MSAAQEFQANMFTFIRKLEVSAKKAKIVALKDFLGTRKWVQKW